MGQPIGLDASIFIYHLEEHEQYSSKAQDIIAAIEAGKYRGIFSIIGIIEVLTGPKKQKRLDLAYNYKQFLIHFPNLTILGVNNDIVDLASDLRAKYNLRTPDAIHLATAIDFNAEKFVTNDQGLKKVKEIKVETLE